MNQSTLQMVYKQFQKQEFYRRYFHDQGCREDGRLFMHHRTIKATLRNNSIVMSQGQTILTAKLQTMLSSVTYSPITLSYGDQLVKIQVSSGNCQSRQRDKIDQAIGQYVSTKINWKEIEDQLVIRDETGKLFAQVGDILINIFGNDGCLEEACLLSVQLLLWTWKVPVVIFDKSKPIVRDFKMLKIDRFLFPFKCCQILGQTLVDPCRSEEESSDWQVTFLSDIIGKQNPRLLQKTSRHTCQIPAQKLSSLVDMWKHRQQQLQLDPLALQSQIKKCSTCLNIIF